MSNAQDIWNALIAAGASSVQAAGIMGNMFYESSLDPESNAVDSNGLRSYGLVQWNAGSYPNAATLVTGNPAQDIKSQINFLAQTGGFRAASGATASEAGSNFARTYEVCQGCQSGGGQNQMRSSKASDFFTMAQTGNWTQASGSASAGTASPASTESTGYDSSTCLLGTSGAALGPFHLSSGSCYFSKTEARALVAGLIIGISGIVFLAGTVILVAYGFKKTGAANAVGSSLSVVAGPTRGLGRVVKKSANARSSSKKESPKEEKETEEETP